MKNDLSSSRRNELSSRINTARGYYRTRAFISGYIDSTLTAGAKHLRMCGEGKKNGWSVLFASMWFTDCPCCLFYRGATFGVLLATFFYGVAELIKGIL